jgi:hypothetical protein
MERRFCFTFFLLALAASASAAGPYRGALVRVDRPPADAVSRLLEIGVPVVRNGAGYLLAVADYSQLERLEHLRMSYRLLDGSVENKSYYTVTHVAAGRTDDLARLARVVFLEDGNAVVEASPEGGDRLSRAGFHVQRVFMRPVAAPRTPERAFAYGVSPPSNSSIEDMIIEISGAEIDGYVARLQDFVTRWAIHDSCQAAAEWIASRFESFDLDSVYYQDIGPFFAGNVVGVLRGTDTPEQMIIIGGHYDSTSDNAYIAPGADDNASGTACVLECARVMSAYQFERTIVFIAFGAEEQGLEGSEYYAAQAAASGEDIVAMINVDMLGYLAPGDDVDIDVVGNPASQWLRDQALAVAATYVPETPAVVGSDLAGMGSDHMSFWDQGYAAILLWEDSDQHSPYIHSAADSIGLSYNHPYLAHQTTRVVAALAADLAGLVDPPIGSNPVPLPAISLEQNVPNPFNPRTMIRFAVPAPGARASLRIYDVAGREIAVLVDKELVAGSRTVWWNGMLSGGRPAPSGVYFYRLTAAGEELTRKLVLVR